MWYPWATSQPICDSVVMTRSDSTPSAMIVKPRLWPRSTTLCTITALPESVSIDVTNDRSIFSSLTGNVLSCPRLVYPAPKSSMAILMPSAKSCSSSHCARAGSVINADKLTGAEAHLRLIVDEKLSAFQPSPQIAQQCKFGW